MSTRTSIDVQAGRCRVVEVHAPSGGRPASPADEVRVTAFATDLPGADTPVALEHALGRLRKERKLTRDACVTLWGLGAMHRVLHLRLSRTTDLRARALSEVSEDVATLGADGGGASVAVSVGRLEVGGLPRREVSLVGVSDKEVRRRIAPIVAAGFLVNRVVTPALALAEVTRRHSDAASAAVTCCVAIEARAVCVTVVRAGALLLADELDWGHAQGGPDIAGRLRAELQRAMSFFGKTLHAPIEAVYLCGDMPNLRALTTPLGAALKVPVQTLDALTGIDAAHVPEPADMFRAQVAALRPAIAAAVAPAPEPNLLPERTGSIGVPVGLVAAATLAALAIYVGWVLLRPGATVVVPEVAQPALPVSQMPAVTSAPEATTPTEAPAVPVTRSTDTPADLTSSPVVAVRRRDVPPPPPDDSSVDSVEVSLILHSADRRLAIVNGRIVGVGDRVGSDTVFDIQPRAVVLESPQGRRRTIPLREPGSRSGAGRER